MEVPSNQDQRGGAWASIWPTDAYQARINGRVVLRCDVDRYGLAEACEVVRETPPSKGFGQAALELRPTLKLKPAVGPDGPIDASMNIAIAFDAPDMQVFVLGGDDLSFGDCGGLGKPCPEWRVIDNPLPIRPATMLNDPIWVATASYDDVMQAYPAKAGGVDGYAVAHCRVDVRGSLGGCGIIKEDPDSRGFGKAALALARRFKVAPQWATAPHHVQPWVDIPFRFPAPAAARDRVIGSPYWITGFDPDQALKIYPPEAAAKGVSSGRGVARCSVRQDGSLSDCAAVEADPPDLGFSEAVVKLVSTMRMNPWSRDGMPVDGATVSLAVRLNLKPTP